MASDRKLSPKERVKVGVIGAGWFASRRHMPDLLSNPLAELTCFCRRDSAARETLSNKFNIPWERTYEDWQTMLDEEDIDAVLIATPNALHFEQAKAALERGLHVLIEKPMTVLSEHAEELVELACSSNLQLGVALNPPFWAHCHKVRRALQLPEMGTLESASLYWTGSAEYVFGRTPAPDVLTGVVQPTMYRSDPALNGGGYCIDGGSHIISELLWLTGLKAKKVSALMDTSPTDMRALLSIELENGAMASLNFIGDSKFPTRRVRSIFGTTKGQVTIISYEFETSIMVHGQEHQKFKEADLVPVPGPTANFVDAILGKAKLFSSGEHGAHVVEVVEAAYASAELGRVVTL